MSEKFDVDGAPIRDGDRIALVHEEGDGSMTATLLLEIADLQSQRPMIQVRVVGLLDHEFAHLFSVGETFEALPWHLSRRAAMEHR